MNRKLTPVSPGEMLAEEFLKPLRMSNYRLAKEIGVPAQRIGAAHRRDHRRQACNYRRYQPAAMPLLRTFRRLVAAFAGRLRYRNRKGGARQSLGEDQALGGDRWGCRACALKQVAPRGDDSPRPGRPRDPAEEAAIAESISNPL
jgi:hypothetical protein